MKQRLFAGFVAISMAATQLAPARTSAQPADAASAETESKAREAFQRGRVHYDNGEFYRAAQAFEEAYQLSGRDMLFYNIYLAYRDANEQERAAEALRNFLTRVEVIENRAQLEARLKALDEGIAYRKAEAERKAEEARLAQEKQQQSETTEATSQTQAQEADAPGRWWLTPVVVMGAGGVMALSSIATGMMAKSKQSELDDKCTNGVCPSDLKSTADSGKTLALVTDVLLFGGIAVGATGAVLLFLKKPRSTEKPSEPTTTAGFACTSKVCGGSVAVRF